MITCDIGLFRMAAQAQAGIDSVVNVPNDSLGTDPLAADYKEKTNQESCDHIYQALLFHLALIFHNLFDRQEIRRTTSPTELLHIFHRARSHVANVAITRLLPYILQSLLRKKYLGCPAFREALRGHENRTFRNTSLDFPDTVNINRPSPIQYPHAKHWPSNSNILGRALDNIARTQGQDVWPSPKVVVIGDETLTALGSTSSLDKYVIITIPGLDFQQALQIIRAIEMPTIQHCLFSVGYHTLFNTANRDANINLRTNTNHPISHQPLQHEDRWTIRPNTDIVLLFAAFVMAATEQLIPGVKTYWLEHPMVVGSRVAENYIEVTNFNNWVKATPYIDFTEYKHITRDEMTGAPIASSASIGRLGELIDHLGED